MAAAFPARVLSSSTTALMPLPSISMPRQAIPLRSLLVCASSGKGFGSTDGKSGSSASEKKSSSKKDESLLRQALDRAASPIDPREASRGRVDVATVKSWKGLDASRQRDAKDTSALGELELESFTPGGREEGGASSASRSSPSSSAPPPAPGLASQPLYEALARRLSVLQASGALAEPASPRASKRSAQRRKLPRFEDWRWSERRYAQFLRDCLEVHGALEAAIEAALAAAEGVFVEGRGGNKNNTSSSSSASSSASSSSSSLAAFAALSYLGPSSGLFRAQEILEDLVAISATSAEDEGKKATSGSGGGGSGGKNAPASPLADLKPSASASATARYLSALGSRAAREVVLEAEETEEGAGGAEARSLGGGSGGGGALLRRRRGGGRGGAGSSGSPPASASASAALRLLANCYALQVTHLTTGMRVGASASEALDLLRRRAAGFYQCYPDDLSLAPRAPPLLLPPPPPPPLLSPSSASSGSGSGPSAARDKDAKRIVDPLRAFRSAVDGAGRVLSKPPAGSASTSSTSSPPSPPPPSPPPPPLLLEEVERELVAAVKRAASLFEPLASAEP